jgi:hypothetical protein
MGTKKLVNKSRFEEWPEIKETRGRPGTLLQFHGLVAKKMDEAEWVSWNMNHDAQNFYLHENKAS